jgi:hypothetical protein
MDRTQTVAECLASIGVTDAQLSSASNLEEEFQTIKKAYHKRVLIVHPDKGGDAARFREVTACFEALKDMFTCKRISSFAGIGSEPTGEAFSRSWKDFEGAPMPSWEYYASAAEEEMPPCAAAR